MDEQEKAFKEYNAQAEQEAMATIEHDIARANDPRVQKEEEESQNSTTAATSSSTITPSTTKETTKVF